MSSTLPDVSYFVTGIITLYCAATSQIQKTYSSVRPKSVVITVQLFVVQMLCGLLADFLGIAHGMQLQTSLEVDYAQAAPGLRTRHIQRHVGKPVHQKKARQLLIRNT
jgi:hypothetical protein